MKCFSSKYNLLYIVNNVRRIYVLQYNILKALVYRYVSKASRDTFQKYNDGRSCKGICRSKMGILVLIPPI